tara:strand:+ start:5066 stop:5167 length:102 start_codon:yes stop_codon:yes gene_type:complete
MWGVGILSLLIMYIAVRYALYVYECDENKKELL